MESELIKQTIKLGNSSAVILPKSWMQQKVRIQLIKDSITEKILKLLTKKSLLKEVIGIYLVGSYARNEETTDSDIDILIITNSLNKQISKDNYEINLISKSKLDTQIRKDLYLLALVKEAQTIINDSLIQDYKKIPISISINKYLKEIISITKINESSINLSKEMKEKVPDSTAYSIILRLRELFLINQFLKNREYSNRDFIAKIKSISSLELYEAYLRIKRNLAPKDNTSPEDAIKLIRYTKELIKNAKQTKKT